VRVLLVSDLHYDLRKLDWVLGRAGSAVDPVDVIVLAGDLLDVGSAVPLDAQITVVLSYLERLAARVPMLVCSGNHDLDCRTASGEKATRWLGEARGVGVHVDGDSFDLDGWRLTACAWWEGPETLADVEARLAAASVGRPRRWLWAFHGPPEGPLSWTGARHHGDPELPRLLAAHRPDLVLCGHIHQAPFVPDGAWAEHRGTTWLFNAGHQLGERPTFIELDLSEARAWWWSSLGSGEVDLADPSTAPVASATPAVDRGHPAGGAAELSGQ
jgi:predicted MPP superfamily phosphohydrolase